MDEMTDRQEKEMERLIYLAFFIIGVNTGVALLSIVLIVLQQQ